MVVAGQSLRDEHVAVLADLVGAELGSRLREAAAHNCSIVALNSAEREQILVALEGLDDVPWSMLGLRDALLQQKRNQRRKQATKDYWDYRKASSDLSADAD
jgi:hypothetical protein